MKVQAFSRHYFGKLIPAMLRWPLFAGTLILAHTTIALSTDSSVTVADASISAAFYSDSSCLLTINALAQSGKTVINADVDDVGSRMLIHCDTKSGRRLTLLARGDSLNVSQRVPLLTREQIQQGEFGMIAWLTRSGVQYADDTAPRRYIIAGSVMLRKTPPADVSGTALHNQLQSFARVSGILEPILKTDSKIAQQPIPLQDENTDAESASEPAGIEDTDEQEDLDEPSTTSVKEN